MYNQHISTIQHALADLPEGLLLEEHYSAAGRKCGDDHTDAILQGKGKKASWDIFSGVTLVFQDYLAQQVSCRHEAESDLLEINYCRYGRIGWKFLEVHTLSIYGDLDIYNVLWRHKITTLISDVPVLRNGTAY